MGVDCFKEYKYCEQE